MRKKLIAMLMILLIVQLPLFVSAQGSVLAHSISGQDGVQNTLRNEDAYEVEAVVEMDGSVVTPDQVWLGFSASFDTCVLDPAYPLEKAYKCTLKFPATGTASFPEAVPYSINLHTDSIQNPPTAFTIVDSMQGVLSVDGFPPRVGHTLSNYRSRDSITVSFTAYDDGAFANNYDSCAGLQSVSFSSSHPQFGKTFSYPVNTCESSEQFIFNVSSVPEGEYLVIIQATDHLNHQSSTNFTVEVDRSGPQFSNMRIVDRRGNDISFIGKDSIDAVVQVEVSRDVDVSTVVADVSSLSSTTGEVSGDCETAGDAVLCSWDIGMRTTAYGQREMTFKGSDDLGNTNIQRVIKQIGRDTVGPKVSSLQTANQGVNGINYLGPSDNTIIVEFDEEGVGLSAEQVFLDLSSVGGSDKLAASECSASGMCSWHHLDFVLDDGSYTISVHEDTVDLLDNPLKESFSGELVMDTSSPEFVTITVRPIGGTENTYEGIATFGDTLEVRAQIFEPGEIVSAHADFSSFISDADSVQAEDCSEIRDNVWECRWISDPIDIEGFIDDSIRLSFEDFQGNLAEYSTDVTVYNILESAVDHWEHSVRCSPSPLDREVSTLVEQRMYCHVSLRGNAEVVSISLGECSQDDESAQYIRTEELLNSQRGTTDPYIKLSLYPAQIDANRLKTSCPLIIVSRTDDSVTSVPEIENVQISVPFMNSPLGDFGKSVERKLEEAKADATGGIFELMTSLNKIFFYAERLCSLITTINRVASMFKGVGWALRNIGNILKGNPVTYPAGVAQETQGQVVHGKSSLTNVFTKARFVGKSGGGIDKFCKFISCRLFYDEVWGNDIGKAIGDWQRRVLAVADAVATGQGLGGEKIGLGGQGVSAYDTEKGGEQGSVSPSRSLKGGRLNPKDSLIISLATLCIPGIVHNLDKYRQIQCLYADCVQTHAEVGVPLTACEDVKAQATCKYVYGEIFQLIPFAGLLNNLISLVKQTLSSPYAVVDMALGAICSGFIFIPGFDGNTRTTTCLFNDVAGMIADVYADISGIQDEWKIGEDYCSRIE